MSRKPVEIVSYHGWGLDHTFWKPLHNMFSEQVNFKNNKRGYFSKPESVNFSENANSHKLIFAHSLGLHLIPKDDLKKADHLFIMGGFTHFFPKTEPNRKREKMILHQMITRFIEHPLDVLRRFNQRAAKPSTIEFQKPVNINHELLLDDLNLLQKNHFPQQKFFDGPPITILHGADDQIVDQSIARDMFHSLRYKSQYFEIKNAGHLFPLTHTDICFNFIHSVISSEIT